MVGIISEKSLWPLAKASKHTGLWLCYAWKEDRQGEKLLSLRSLYFTEKGTR